MAADVGLPPGFELDPAPAAAGGGLPPGFTPDRPAAAGGRTIVEPNALMRAAGIRKNRYKDENLAGNIGSGILSFGEDMGREARLAALDYGASPGVANTAAFAADAATNFIPIGGSAKAGAELGKPAMEGGAKWFMRSALKPDAAARAGGAASDAAKAIQTMLDEGVNATTGGATKMRDLISGLNRDVTEYIARSTDVVDKSHVLQEVRKTLDKFKNQVNPGSDTKAIQKSWEEFNGLVGDAIPIQTAQELKQGTYKVLSDKYAKGGLPAVENEASTQAQMAMARGLRTGIEEKIPEVAKLNAREHGLINALEITEKRAGVAGNRDIGGIAWLASNPAAAAAFVAGRSELFKSIVARLMYQGREAIPATGAATATAAALNNKE